ncbi:RNA polymerase sigma factor [Brevundimonas sp. TSRC1-1]|uniref:RNA polymerase sigma factor n=1 Tax=Brevundimonas sp. TSRC1-1 TaxID=2804562 RepID=UPI003CF1BEB1
MGRDQTFEALLAEHGGMLRRIASAYEADRERRRELEQDILLAVWRALPKHRGEAPLRHFIARVAHNRAVTHVAREAAETRDLHERLGQAVRALPLSLRQPALLTLEGFAPAEIADMLGLNPNTVSIRLTRAKAALREALNPAPSQEVRP